ncbi:Autophagy protein 22 [Diaporthe eres]|uniref:Autophagy-related protein n=1 Tax=Diaporthe eres TaxID=83184 RepID=A0ABR1PL23_DIAER
MTSDMDRHSDSESNHSPDPPSPPIRYAGEDTRQTSPKELRGWYMYAFAAETYVICAIGSFIPILLESLARENGVLLKNGKPCGPSNEKSGEDTQCVVHVLGLEINTASFAMYTFSASVLLQALLVVSISSFADHGQYRKKLLLAFAWLGSFCVMLYIFVTKETYVFGAVLAIISNVSFGASFVLLNSFLPLLVRYHPKVLYAEGTLTPDLAAPNGESQRLEHPQDDDETETFRDSSSSTALLGDEGPHRLRKVLTHEDQTSIELALSTEISAKGIGIGYAAGLFLQCVAILILIKMRSSTWSLRVVLCMIGLWWAFFTIPAALWLRPRPGPPLPAQKSRKGVRAFIAYTLYAWKSLFKTVSLARRLLDIMLFLAAWFLLSDAIATTSSTAILFAKTTLQMEPWSLGLIGVISTTFGIAGALSWSYISRRFSLKPHQTLLSCIALFELIPLYGLLGYLPFVRAWGVLGLQQPWEMFPLAGVYGFVLGGLSSYCRALYGELIPPGSEAAFYALYAITDKGSSVFGPFIVASIIDATGEIRPAFWFLACLVGLPAPLIYFVNAERGKLEAERLAAVVEGYKAGQRDAADDGRESRDGEGEAMLGHDADVEHRGS